MGAFPLLEVFIGLAFVYLLLALVCTTLMEWIAQWRNLRGTHLRAGTQQILGEDEKNKALTDAYFAHPLIQAMRDGKKMPSYVPGKTFAKTLRHVLKSAPDLKAAAPVATEHLKQTFEALRPGDTTDATADELPSEETLAEWYDQSMERVSGVYKRTTRAYVLALSFTVVIAMNANTVTLAGTLWRNPTLRASLVESAKVRLEQGPPLETVEYTDPENPDPTAPDTTAAPALSPNQLLEEEQELLGSLFGWKNERANLAKLQTQWGSAGGGIAAWLVIAILGWTVSALAVSLGAPFWFDTLNRFMQLRSAGRPPKPATLATAPNPAGGQK